MKETRREKSGFLEEEKGKKKSMGVVLANRSDNDSFSSALVQIGH